MLKRTISLLVIASMMFTTVFSIPLGVYADEVIDTETETEVEDEVDTFALNNVAGSFRYWDPSYIKYTTNGFLYNDGLFFRDPTQFDDQLALMSMYLCMTTFVPTELEPEHYADCVYDFLNDLGFSDVEANADFTNEIVPMTTAVACAHKTIVGEDGEKYTLLVILPRSATYFKEWAINMRTYDETGVDGDHKGFSYYRDQIFDFTRDYISEHGVSGKIKVWTTGYSRGGGVTNLVSAALINNAKKCLGSKVSLQPGDIYAYCFGTPRVADENGDYADEKYNCIHNYYDGGDLMSFIPPTGERYGVNNGITSGWTGYRRYKFDSEAMKSGMLQVVRDNDSYLPRTQAAYVDSICQTLRAFMDREASDGDGRKAYYENYQQPLTDFMEWAIGDSQLDFTSLIGGSGEINSNMIPLLLSMYVTFMLDKSLRIGMDISDVLESAFNELAVIVENEDGSVKEEYSDAELLYQAVRTAGFRRVTDAEGNLKYELRMHFDTSTRIGRMAYNAFCKALLRACRGLSSRLYKNYMLELLESADTDQETIDKLTSDEACDSMSWLAANLFLDNILQSNESIEYFSFENEQFKQFATLYNNINALISPHIYSMIMWYFGWSYKVYPDKANTAGYRRVYVERPVGATVSGTVTNADGIVIAEFSDGRMISRTAPENADQWVGITAADDRFWLRIPINSSYKVNFEVSKSCKINLAIGEYSALTGEEVRLDTGDDECSWSGITLKPGETVTLDLPEIESNESGYSLPSDIYYSNSTSKDAQDDTSGDSVVPKQAEATAAAAPAEVLDPSIPKVKELKVKAASRSFKANWKKLSSKNRKKFSKIEVQYSTDASFSGSAVKTKTLGKKKTSTKIKGLNKGQTYYVRVRNIKYVNNVKHVSSWTKAKKVKVK